MNTKVTLKHKIDYLVFGWIINLAYSQYYRPKYGYMPYYKLFVHYFLPQKLARLNTKSKWPIHFTSTVIAPQNIKKGILCDPGDNPNIYIQANSGIHFGSNVGIGSGAKIISSNHNHNNHALHTPSEPIRIGNNVFIGANAVLLPGVQIGDNVVIGAGSVVTKNIPSNSIAAGNPCVKINDNAPYLEDFSSILFNKKIPRKFKNFIQSTH